MMLKGPGATSTAKRRAHLDDAANHDALCEHVVIVRAPLARWSGCGRVRALDAAPHLTTAFPRHDEAPCQRGPRQLRHSSRAVTAEPIHKVAYPLSNWGLWPETNSALEIGRIGTGL